MRDTAHLSSLEAQTEANKRAAAERVAELDAREQGIGSVWDEDWTDFDDDDDHQSDGDDQNDDDADDDEE